MMLPTSIAAMGQNTKEKEGLFSSLLHKIRPDVSLRMRAEAAMGGPLENQEFGSLMDYAGKMRPTDPEVGSYVDRFAQGMNVSSQPGANLIGDIPINLGLAAGYEGVKALPESLGNPILEKAGYERKKEGQQTSKASMANIYGLLSGILK